MNSFVQAILAAAGVIFLVGACGASFALGTAWVWRWMAWAPINITVNVNNNHTIRKQSGGPET